MSVSESTDEARAKLRTVVDQTFDDDRVVLTVRDARMLRAVVEAAVGADVGNIVTDHVPDELMEALTELDASLLIRLDAALRKVVT